MRLRLVYILCPGHSGSTLLDLLIASHSQIATIGEAKILTPSRGVASRRRCTCGVKGLLRCAFWSAVDARLREATGMRLDDLNVEDPDPRRFAHDNLALLSSVAAVSGRTILVDSSKSPSRLKRLFALSEIDVRPIQLRRAAGGVVYSNVKKGRSWPGYALDYARHYARTAGLLAGRDAHHLRYEALASNPAPTLASVMDWLNLEFEERQLSWRDQSHHSLAGNHMRLRSNGEIRLDEAWRSRLSTVQKLGTALLSTPGAGYAAVLVERLLLKRKSTR